MPVTYSNGYAMVVARTIDIAFAGFIWREPGVTISSLCGLEMRKPRPRLWARVLNAMLNAIEKNHCELAIICDRERAQAALALLGPS